MNTSSNEGISLKGQKFGRFIDENLSSLLMRYISMEDREMVAGENNVSLSTVSKVIARANVLTEHNSKAIMKLVKLAINRCDEVFENSIKDRKELEDFIEYNNDNTQNPEQ